MRPMISYRFKAVLSGACLLLFFAVSPAFSEDSASPAPSASSNTALQEKIDRWKELREKDPQAFEQKIREHKGQLKNRMQKFQQENPQKFEKFKEQFVQRRQQRMQNLRQENPEKFKQVMNNREQRFSQWKEKNPEKYNQFMQNHPKFQERMQNRENRMHGQGGDSRGKNQENRREQFKQYAKDHPEAAKKFEENHPRFQQKEGEGQGKREFNGQRGPNQMQQGQPGPNFQERRQNFRNNQNTEGFQGKPRDNFGGQRPMMNGRPGLGLQEGQGQGPQKWGPGPNQNFGQPQGGPGRKRRD